MMYNSRNIYEINIDLFLTIMTQKSLIKSGICKIIKSDDDDFFLHLVFLLINLLKKVKVLKDIMSNEHKNK